MGEFGWPVFDAQPLDDGRSWSATFDSYDQRNDYAYYAIRIGELGITAMIAPYGDDWSTPEFARSLQTQLAEIALSGASNTPYVAYALRS